MITNFTIQVTVYRLICKETVEEKILQRASQKSTVQQLVMTGGHVQGDLLAPEDVVSLLIDDAQLEQKLKEIPLQVKDKLKKKRVNKGIRIDAEGDASLEDLDKVANEAAEIEPSPDPEKPKSNHKKRKTGDKSKQKAAKASNTEITDAGLMPGNEFDGYVNNPDQQQRPKRPKRERPTKSVNENIEPAFTASPAVVPIQPQNLPFIDQSSGAFAPLSEENLVPHQSGL